MAECTVGRISRAASIDLRLCERAHGIGARGGLCLRGSIGSNGQRDRANTGNDVFTRSKPYLERLTADLRPTAHLLDTYSPQAFCTIRNFADVADDVAFDVQVGGGIAAHG